MRTYTTQKPTGTDAATDHFARQQDRVNQELQHYNSTTVKVERRTRGLRFRVVGVRTVAGRGKPGNFAGLYVPGTSYDKGEDVVIQSGPGAGNWISVIDNNSNAPTTGIGWIQRSTLQVWY